MFQLSCNFPEIWMWKTLCIWVASTWSRKGSFTSLVFSSTGGMGKAATVMYQHFANILCDKSNFAYSLTMGWLRCSLSFSLLCSSLICLCWFHSSTSSPGIPAAVDLVAAEGHLTAGHAWLIFFLESVGFLFCRYCWTSQWTTPSLHNLVYFLRDVWVEGSAIRVCNCNLCCIIVQRNTQHNMQRNYANLTFPVIMQLKKYGTMM